MQATRPAPTVSVSFAFGAAGVATLVSLVLLGRFPLHGANRSADDEETRTSR
jgi:hypothetical protein